MNSERLHEIIEILSRYSPDNHFINYYEIFDLKQNMTVEEILSYIKAKKLQVLFHPDQLAFIPTPYQEKYLQMIDIVKQMQDDFSNYLKKENYDQKLNQALSLDMHQKKMESIHPKAEDLEELKLKNAIIFNSLKYGFEFTKDALFHLITNNSNIGFTHEHDVRNTIASISKTKLISILSQSSIFDSTSDIESIIMNYLTDMIYQDSMLKIKIDSLERACTETMCKYDLPRCTMQTQQALNEFSLNGNSLSFTNHHNARVDLIANVSHMDVKFFIQCLLNHQRQENAMFSYQNMKNLDIKTLNGTYCGWLYQKLMTNHYQQSEKTGFNR